MTLVELSSIFDRTGVELEDSVTEESSPKEPKTGGRTPQKKKPAAKRKAKATTKAKPKAPSGDVVIAPPPAPFEAGIRDDARQLRIDAIRSTMNQDILSEMDHLCSQRPSYTDIRQFILERTGEDVGIAHVANWWRSAFPVGGKAKLVNESIDGYSGVDDSQIASLTAGKSVELLLKVFDHFVEDQSKFEQLSPAQAIALIPSLLKVRSFADDLNKQRVAYDTLEMELGGAATAIQELLIVFKDTALEEPIKQASSGVFKKIRERYLGSSR